MVDIIVPVYNGYDYLKPCIDSVAQHGDLTKNRLIIIDDKSPEGRVFPHLKEIVLAYKDLNILLLQNDKNMGFVASVNRGMKESDKNDVILLNSDTEVTQNFVSKIQSAAYSRFEIATVTPLTNNGTLVSVPNFCEDNELPADISLSDYAKMIEETSLKIYPEIPTANGYCMFIKRRALDVCGYFDEKTFGKGYGEENDFSFRAIENGFVNICADDTFIYHKGTQSFGADKDQRIADAGLILDRRYPRLRQYTSQYVVFKHNSVIGKNVGWQLNLGDRKNILAIVHSWIDSEDDLRCVGGVTLHLWDMIRSMKDEYNFFVLSHQKDGYRLSVYHKGGSEEFLFPLLIYYDLKYHNQSYSKMISDIIKNFDIDLVHLQHTAGHTLDIPYIAKEFGVRSVCTIHDLAFICPLINCVDDEKKFCGPSTDHEKCSLCLSRQKGIQSDIIEAFRDEHKKFLEGFDSVITPSQNTADIINGIFPSIKIDARYHGLMQEEYKTAKRADKSGFNVAFIGGVAIHKGSGKIASLIKKCKDKDINFYIFGAVYDEEIRALAGEGKKVRLIENYMRVDIISLLQSYDIDLVGIFSIWPETFSYTLSEAMMANIPTLAFDIGAVAERITANNAGFLMDIESSASEIYQKLISIIEDTEGYNEKQAALKDYKHKTLPDMASEYKALYNRLTGEKKRFIKDRKFIESIFSGVLSTDDTVYRSLLLAAEDELAYIKGSIKYKIISKLQFPPVIGKTIRKVFKKI